MHEANHSSPSSVTIKNSVPLLPSPILLHSMYRENISFMMCSNTVNHQHITLSQFYLWGTKDTEFSSLILIIVPPVIASKLLCTRVVPKVTSKHFLHANQEQQTKYSIVVDGTSCCVILECLVTSTACIM